MKIDAMVEWSAEERATKEKEWRQALFTLKLQKATGQLDNPMRLREIRRDIARLKTLDHMDAARAAALKIHAEHEGATRTAAPARAADATAKAAPTTAPEAATAAAAPTAAQQAGRPEETVSSKGKKAAAVPKPKGKGGAKGKAASAKSAGKKTTAAGKGPSLSKKKKTSPVGKVGSSAKSASRKKSK